MKPDTVKICSNHEERPTPLVWTFAFRGAEYWCPYCGRTEGMLGAGESVPATPELIATGKADRTPEMRDYLFGLSYRSASQVNFNGKWISPNELPEEEKKRLAQVVANWKYPISEAA